jgi:cell division protein FtsL
MKLRILNAFVICGLIMAASYVYKIKFDATQRVERAAKLRMEIRREQDAIGNLRAQLAKLETPSRIQSLAERHLKLRPTSPQQFQSFEKLPMRPQVAQAPADLIGGLIAVDTPTGSVTPQMDMPSALPSAESAPDVAAPETEAGK